MSCVQGRWWRASLTLVVLAASCEPRIIEIQGLDELTSEIRSQRLLNSRRAATGNDNPAAGKASPTIPSEQIHAAMSPLRDVLTQMAANHKNLSGRQATLTQEMRRWTQLLVESMQANRADAATKLDKRLAELEKSIAEQDARHRQVEELLGSALDATADQLEDFLKRLGGGIPEAGPVAPNASGTPTTGSPKGTGGGQPTGAASTAAPATGNTASPNNTTPPNKPPNKPPTGGGAAKPTGAGGGEPQQASMRWLWWSLALLSVASGLVLLRGKRRPQPVAMAPEMQFAPERTAQEFVPEQKSRLAKPVATSKDDPEVEELWAAAALLGEAIGRLKQTGDATPVELGGHEALPEAPDFELPDDLDARTEPAGHEDLGEELGLDEMFVIDEDESDLLEPTQLHDATQDVETEAIHTLGLPDPVAESEPQVVIEPMATAQPCADPRVQLPSAPLPSAPLPSAPAPQSLPAPGQATLTPDVEAIAAAETIRQPSAGHGCEAPITCRLHLPANQQAAGRVRRLLGSDPRVLVSPAPQIHSEMGEIEVSFALLPGLPPGERSLLEQQLRDTVA